jgi:hypothetical protein
LAEDLFVMKAFAARPLDWIDAEGIAVRQAGALNQRYIPVVEMAGAVVVAQTAAKFKMPDFAARAKAIFGDRQTHITNIVLEEREQSRW